MHVFKNHFTHDNNISWLLKLRGGESDDKMSRQSKISQAPSFLNTKNNRAKKKLIPDFDYHGNN